MRHHKWTNLPSKISSRGIFQTAKSWLKGYFSSPTLDSYSKVDVWALLIRKRKHLVMTSLERSVTTNTVKTWNEVLCCLRNYKSYQLFKNSKCLKYGNIQRLLCYVWREINCVGVKRICEFIREKNILHIWQL